MLFYLQIIETNEDKTKLITKYNLYVGDKIEKDDVFLADIIRG